MKCISLSLFYPFFERRLSTLFKVKVDLRQRTFHNLCLGYPRASRRCLKFVKHSSFFFFVYWIFCSKKKCVYWKVSVGLAICSGFWCPGLISLWTALLWKLFSDISAVNFIVGWNLLAFSLSNCHSYQVCNNGKEICFSYFLVSVVVVKTVVPLWLSCAR